MDTRNERNKARVDGHVVVPRTPATRRALRRRRAAFVPGSSLSPHAQINPASLVENTSDVAN